MQGLVGLFDWDWHPSFEMDSIPLRAFDIEDRISLFTSLPGISG